MKKTLNINLGGTAFIIDENAFELLHNYLEALKRKFSNEAERDEILNDIEARIGEMLNQKLAGRREVVSVEDVQLVMDAMGKPEVIAGEETATETASTTSSTSYTYAAPIKKRLFRDPDGGKVGGVIAGLCHYFGINDPVWARLAVVILFFISWGVVLIIYFLLMLVIPKAQTSAEKLQMKGEPINISTIEREIKDAAVRTGESVNKFVREEPFVEKLWGAFVTIAKGTLKLIATIFIIIGLIVIFILIAGLFGVSFAGNAMLAHAPHLLIDNPGALTAFKAGLALFVAVPLIALIYAALRLIFGKRTQAPPILKWVMVGGWFIGIILMAYGGMTVGREFSTKAVKNEEMTLMQPTNGTLMVQITDTLGNKLSPNEEDDDEHNSFQITPAGVFINGMSLEEMERIPLGEPWLQLMPSENDSFYVQKAITTHGKNKGDALTNSGYVIYNFSQTDTILNLPANLELDKKGKFRAQEMKLRIAIPEGKFVSFANNIDRWKATVKGDNSYNDTYFANTTWTTRNGKVICVKGENHFNAEADEEIEKLMEENDKNLSEEERKLEKKIIIREKKQEKAAKDDESKEDF